MMTLGLLVVLTGAALFCCNAQDFSKDSRLVIVGAGPAGIHLAAELKKQGYSSITLLERTHRVGGKSLTLYRDEQGAECVQQRDPNTRVVDTTSCIAHEMGTCFLHNGYHVVPKLLEEYGLTPPQAVVGRSILSEYSPSPWSALALEDWITESILAGVSEGKIELTFAEKAALFFILPKDKGTATMMFALANAVQKYNALHDDIFNGARDKRPEFTMPARLSSSSLQKINMTFAEFLSRNGLYALAPFLTFAHGAQGYGYVKSIPAYYGLLWITPELMNGYMQMSFHNKIAEISSWASHSTLLMKVIQDLTQSWVGGNAEEVSQVATTLPEGYEKIWRTIHEKESLDVRFGAEIAPGGIDRQLGQSGAGVKVTYRQDGGAWKTEEFDFLLYTAPHAHSSKYVMDLTVQESSIFRRLRSFVITATLYRSDTPSFFTVGDSKTTTPLMYNTPAMDSSIRDGSWYADRNDPYMQAGLVQTTGTLRTAGQFFENYCSFDSALCNTDRTPDPEMDLAPKVLQELEAEFSAASIGTYQVLNQFAWPYFHHFEQDAIQSGLPWDVLDMQGSSKTWWLGASAVFESVHDVTSYNLMMIDARLAASTSASTGQAQEFAV